jgi:hypothetical protein
MAIRIKRSSGNTAPATLDGGQLAYAEGSTNGGTLYYGEISGTVREIGGRKFVDKLNGIEAGAQVNAVTSVAGRTGAITLAVADVTNAESTGNKGQANGYASLDSNGKVPSTQLPSYVDDVLEYNDLASFPATGTAGIIYVAQDTNKTYRWSGSTYVEISASPGSTDAVTEGSTNLYFTNGRARSAISVTDSGGDGSLSYDNSTGVITYTGPSASDVRAHFSGGTGITITDGVVATTITQYTDALARSSVSATDAGGDGSFSYNSSSGVFTYTGPGTSDYRAAFSGGTGITITDGVVATTITQYADSNARAAISVTDNGGDGALSYNSSSGVISYTGPSASEVRAHFSGGTGITITDGVVATTITQGITDVVQDTTPQLGGDLDINGKKIVTVSNGSIVIAPNGSGNVILNETGTGLVIARRTNASGTTGNGLFVQRNYTADVLANMDGHTAGLVFSQRDSANAQAFYTRLAGEYATDGGHAHWFEKSTNNGTSWIRQATLGDNQLVMGALTGTTTQQIGTYGVQDLALGTNASGSNVGGVIFIEAGANGGIELVPDGTGAVTIDGLIWPTADGSANQVLKTNGSGVLSWVTQTAGVTVFTGLSDVPASYSGTGGYYVKVNSGATALEFSQHVDDGTF